MVAFYNSCNNYYLRWRHTGNFNEKISDSKIHIFANNDPFKIILKIYKHYCTVVMEKINSAFFKLYVFHST